MDPWVRLGGGPDLHVTATSGVLRPAANFAAVAPAALTAEAIVTGTFHGVAELLAPVLSCRDNRVPIRFTGVRDGLPKGRPNAAGTAPPVPGPGLMRPRLSRLRGVIGPMRTGGHPAIR